MSLATATGCAAVTTPRQTAAAAAGTPTGVIASVGATATQSTCEIAWPLTTPGRISACWPGSAVDRDRQRGRRAVFAAAADNRSSRRAAGDRLPRAGDRRSRANERQRARADHV